MAFLRRWKKKYQRPANQTGALNGSMDRTSCPKNAMTCKSTFRPVRRIFACSSRNGKCCWIFQIRFGRKIPNAINPAIQIQGVRHKRFSGVNSRPTSIPKPKIAIEYLFSRPSPARRPNQSHNFWSPVLMMRIITKTQPIQNKGSKAFIDSQLSMAKNSGATRTEMADSPWAKREPPSSRAMKPVSTTFAAPASAGNNRIA